MRLVVGTFDLAMKQFIVFIASPGVSMLPCLEMKIILNIQMVIYTKYRGFEYYTLIRNNIFSTILFTNDNFELRKICFPFECSHGHKNRQECDSIYRNQPI